MDILFPFRKAACVAPFWFALLVNLTAPLRADLTWTTKEIDLHPKLDDPEAIAHFTFQNTGTYSIEISSVTTSCPCTTAHADKTTYRPGEKGEITADFSVPILTGLQEKRIFVVSGPKHLLTTLDLKVFVPEVMKLMPSALTWRVNEACAPKTIVVDMIAPVEMNATGVHWGPRDHHFVAQLQTIQPHQKYLITVTPADTSAPAQETLRIGTDYPSYQVKSVFVPIRIISPGAN